MVKKLLNNGWIIFLVIFIIFIRFYNLDKVPVHLGNDEISLAYDAYSIGKTLRDEHNHFLPLSFESHGDYKAPLYVYLSVIPVKIFGNTEFSIRFISAFSGILTIIFLYLLTLKISGDKTIALCSAGVLALSPWHIYASRIAWESNLAFLLVLLGIYCYVIAHDSEKHWLSLAASSLFFGLSAYAYHTQKLLSPLLVFFLPFLLPLKSKKDKYLYWLMGLVLFIPIVIGFFQQLGTSSRANTQMIWNIPTIHDYLLSKNNLLILKFSVLLSAFISNYSSHINLGYLFFNGLNLFQKGTPYQFGLLLAASLPFLIIGIISGKRYFKTYFSFLIFLTIFAPIVPSLTRGEPNIGRNLPSLIPYCILVSAGLITVWKRAKSFIKVIIIFSHFLFFSYFLIFYFFHFPVHSGENWQYGYKQIALAIKPVYSKHKQIVIDPRFGQYSQYIGVPHLYIPYFSKFDPELVLKRPENNGDIGKYKIHDINWAGEDKNISGNLYVVPESNLPPAIPNLQLFKVINYPNGKPAFRIFEGQ